MFVTTIIPTIGRPSLERAVRSVLAQKVKQEFEVIVVNDSGLPLPEADWQLDRKATVIDTDHRERCVARNAGAAVAHGRYLHFLDDDDWLLPNALATLAALASHTGRPWLYGGSQLVDRAGVPLIELHPDLDGNCSAQIMSGEWMPLQASLIDAALFFTIGGFNPAIPGAEDIHLSRQLSLVADIAGTRDLVACVGMGEQGSTTDYPGSRKLLRAAREETMEKPGTWRRLHSSAASPYWHGRITRIYLTSMLWNIGKRHLWTASERACEGAASLVVARTGLFTGHYWEGLLHAYRSESFARGLEAARLSRKGEEVG